MTFCIVFDSSHWKKKNCSQHPFPSEVTGKSNYSCITAFMSIYNLTATIPRREFKKHAMVYINFNSIRDFV